MKDLKEAMVEWHRERYLDPGVWEHLGQKISPAAMPTPSVLQALPPPPGGAGYSALQRLPHPPQGARHPSEFHAEVVFCHSIICKMFKRMKQAYIRRMIHKQKMLFTNILVLSFLQLAVTSQRNAAGTT